MKLRWHLLFLIVATSSSLILANWLSQPIWISDGYEVVRFAGKNASRSELTSLCLTSNQTECFMVVHDWRTGQLLRKMPLEVPVNEDAIYQLNIADEGDGSQAPLVLTQFLLPQNISCYLLDGTTGKRLLHDPIEDRCRNEKLARHKTQLALSLRSGVRLFRDKSDFGRSIPLPSTTKICFSPDGGSLVCIGGNGLLYHADAQTGEVTTLSGCDKEVSDISFLSNGQLLVITRNQGSGSMSQLGVQASRWVRKGTVLQQTQQSVLLRTDEALAISIPVQVEEEDAGIVQIGLYPGWDWPEGLTRVLSWLTDRGFATEKWLTKRNFLVCFKLNSSNQVVSMHKKWFDERFNLDKDFTVSYRPNWHEGKTIVVFSTRRIWPWAVAVGILIYAALWRAALWRRRISE